MSFLYNGVASLSGTPAILEIKYTWESDGSGDATETTVDLPCGFVMELLTNPSADAPTDDYDIVVNDSDGVDVLRGIGANRDTTTSERAVPQINGIPYPTAFSGALTFVVSNAGATNDGVAKLYIRFPGAS